MKSLVLINPLYQDHLKYFSHWLQTLGYSQSTCYNLPNHMKEFFYYLEQQQINGFTDIVPSLVQSFFSELQSRSHQRKPGKLSAAHLRKYLQALKKFSEYMQRMNLGDGLSVGALQLNVPETGKKLYFLSNTEIEALYAACANDALGLRDRAMLSLYYGCGLRRTEGTRLNVWDIKFKRKVVYVAHSKNGEERGVPMPARVINDFHNYLYNSRPGFLNSRTNAAFFMGMKGDRVSGQMLQRRLKTLAHKADFFSPEQIDQIGLHTLRHSIATHLLQSGMSLQNIALFLGHKSLESTQIYTHVSRESVVGSQ